MIAIHVTALVAAICVLSNSVSARVVDQRFDENLGAFSQGNQLFLYKSDDYRVKTKIETHV